jgi:hypothetical protein
VTPKQDLTGARLSIGSFGPSGATRWYIRDGDRVAEGDMKTPVPDDIRRGTLTGGDYLAFCGAPLGSVAVFNLGEEPIGYDGWSLEIPLSDGKAQAGQALSATLLTVGAPFTAPGDNGWVEEFRTELGMAGEAGYQVDVTAGQIVSQRYMLRLDGQGQGFAGVIRQADLPIALPVLVMNLCPNWSVGLYDRPGERYRPLAQMAGTAHATVDANEADLDLFIGHPFVCDQQALVLSATQTGDRQFAVEVHNPTAGRIETTVRPAEAFTLIKAESKTVVVEPGTSEWLQF